MKAAPSLAIKLTAGAFVLYLLGFFLLYPLFAKFTVGKNPGFTLAISARAVHELIYQPFMDQLGENHPISKLWGDNALWWCHRINGEEQCGASRE